MDKGSKIIVVVLVAALAVVSASLAAAIGTLMTISSSDIDTEVLSPPANSTSFLFVQHASSGTIEPENDPSTDAIYKLTLNGVYSNTMIFSDRPDRNVGQITTGQYAEVWTKGQDSFEADPPNAALVMNQEDASENIIVVELLNPVYDAEKETLVYDIVELNPEEGMNAFQASNATLPSSFGQATLFIDSAIHKICHPAAWYKPWDWDTCTIASTA